MTNSTFAFVILFFTLAILSLISACTSLQTPNNPTTQALGEVSAVTSAVAPVVSVAAPPPWGQIVAGVLGAVSVIAGMVAHSTVAKTNTQQVVNAVTSGLQAASQTIGSALPASTNLPATK